MEKWCREEVTGGLMGPWSWLKGTCEHGRGHHKVVKLGEPFDGRAWKCSCIEDEARLNAAREEAIKLAADRVAASMKKFLSNKLEGDVLHVGGGDPSEPPEVRADRVAFGLERHRWVPLYGQHYCLYVSLERDGDARGFELVHVESLYVEPRHPQVVRHTVMLTGDKVADHGKLKGLLLYPGIDYPMVVEAVRSLYRMRWQMDKERRAVTARSNPLPGEGIEGVRP